MSHRQVTLNYGLTREHIRQLIDQPITGVPPHHQVDPRVIKAHLIPARNTRVPRWNVYSSFWAESLYPNWQYAIEYLTEHSDRPLVDDRYRHTYLSWSERRERNSRDIPRVLEYCTRGSLRGGQILWEDGYLRTYHYFSDHVLRSTYYRSLPQCEYGVIWHARQSASTIYATAKAILQLCPDIPTVPLPDFRNLSQDDQERIYSYIEGKLDSALHYDQARFVYEAISYGRTGPDLASIPDNSYSSLIGRDRYIHRLPVQTFAIATVCKYQVIASQSYSNFHSIDQLRQLLLDRFSQKSDAGDPWYRHELYLESHFRHIRRSWEGGEPSHLPIIPDDDDIESLFSSYQDTERGVEDVYIYNAPPRSVASSEDTDRDSNDTENLFDETDED